MWEVFRGAMRGLIFNSWVDYMDYIINPDDWEVTKTKKNLKTELTDNAQ